MHGEEGLKTARRRGAVAAAGHLGDEATARTALSDPAAAVRSTALGALLRLGRLGLAELDHAFGDTAIEVRRCAAELAWRTTEPGPGGLAAGVSDRDGLVALLTRELDDEAGAVVEAVCYSLGELRSPGAVVDLADVALHHSDPLCRESAVAALGSVGSDEALPPILEAMNDKPAVRRRAVLALASFEGPEVDSALEQALSDRDWQVRQAAEDLSGARPQPG